ncbi:unnamed protein product [Caenorhabditis angaria]|uniref:Uncharacterized protein n=1 Tax=Caenorhabditis angaria TaxID=860376 RepID=A0A9P1I812_9PELO|nr:unnamed protein product [Caenorhabditis angaria]
MTESEYRGIFGTYSTPVNYYVFCLFDIPNLRISAVTLYGLKQHLPNTLIEAIIKSYSSNPKHTFEMVKQLIKDVAEGKMSKRGDMTERTKVFESMEKEERLKYFLSKKINSSIGIEYVFRNEAIEGELEDFLKKFEKIILENHYSRPRGYSK